MDEFQTQPGKEKPLILVGVILVVLLTIIVVGAVIFSRPRLVSPLSEEAGDVKVIFVSPSTEASATNVSSPSATPKASNEAPKSSPKASPKASVKPSGSPASPSATPAT